jgi:hypothetical protein
MALSHAKSLEGQQVQPGSHPVLDLDFDALHLAELKAGDKCRVAVWARH